MIHTTSSCCFYHRNATAWNPHRFWLTKGFSNHTQWTKRWRNSCERKKIVLFCIPRTCVRLKKINIYICLPMPISWVFLSILIVRHCIDVINWFSCFSIRLNGMVIFVSSKLVLIKFHGVHASPEFGRIFSKNKRKNFNKILDGLHLRTFRKKNKTKQRSIDQGFLRWIWSNNSPKELLAKNPSQLNRLQREFRPAKAGEAANRNTLFSSLNLSAGNFLKNAHTTFQPLLKRCDQYLLFWVNAGFP